MQSTITKSAMINGLIIGFLLSLKFLLSTQKTSILVSLGLVISVSIIFILFRMSIRLRNDEFDGIISFGKAFSYILQVYFYGSIISSLVMFMYTAYFNQAYLEMYLNMVMKFYHDINFLMDDKNYKIMESIFKPAPFALSNIFSSIFAGAFWGLILAGFIKKEKNIFEQ
jgi:hypothetical protein